MSTDYTLPPVPKSYIHMGLHVWNERNLRDYGHACAEHARAPLLARIAELEAEIAQVSGYCETLTQRCVDDTAENGRLRAEVEALRADAAIEWEPGRSYTAAELLRRAIQGLRVRKGQDLWPAVRNMCGVGSGVAHYLCRWAGRDPETGREIAAIAARKAAKRAAQAKDSHHD